MRKHSLAHRRLILSAVVDDGMSQKDAAAAFDVAQSTISRWIDEADQRIKYRYAPMTYRGGWVRQGGVLRPIEPMPRGL